MPEAISSLPSSFCDPEIASCEEFPPPAAGESEQTVIVELEPVVVTGDAGAQALLRRYDASLACGAETQAAKLSCPTIAVGVLNALEGGPLAGIATSLTSSVICGKDLRALLDCQDGAAGLASSAAQVVGRCNERGGAVKAGESRNEIICEVAP